jgi:hypothetical protein
MRVLVLKWPPSAAAAMLSAGTLCQLRALGLLGETRLELAP